MAFLELDIGLSASACELTDTYSPVHRHGARNQSRAAGHQQDGRRGAAAATPAIRLAVDTILSLAPRIAARSQPMRVTAWFSRTGYPLPETMTPNWSASCWKST